MKKIDGYFPLYWDERTGIDVRSRSRASTPSSCSRPASRPASDRTTSVSIAAQRRQGRIVQFQRVGPRVMLVQGNQSFRSSSKNPLERKSVEDSFAKSILWGFTVAAESNGRVLVDATDFFLRDVQRRRPRAAARHLSLDRTRSAFYLPNTKNFPKNTEVDMTLTFVNEAAGGGGGGGGGPAQGPAPIGSGAWRAAVVAAAAALFSGSVAQRHAVAGRGDAARARVVRRAAGRQLQPRIDDPRAGYGGLSFVDYSPPIGEPMRDALHPPPSPAEEGSVGRDERAGQADPVLGRLGRAGRRQEGAASKARAGGTRRSRPPASATRSRSRCCPTAPTRWTSATT